MRNKKIYVSMLALSICFLVGMYILKMFLPEQFILAIQNGRIIEIGTYIDTHLWLRFICYIITSFITYWLFCCACCHRLTLKWYECLYILAVIALVAIFRVFDTNISTHISISSFIILPAVMKGDLKTTAIIYFIHGLSQCLMLKIRNLPMYLTSVNYLTVFFVGIETYLWLMLFYIICNYKKER